MADKGKSTVNTNTVAVIHASGSGELIKKQRGRPRKFDAAGNLVVPQGSCVASQAVMSGVSSPGVMSGVAPMPIASLPLMRAVASIPVASLPLMRAVASMPMINAVVSPPVISVVPSPPVVLETAPVSHSPENSANSTQGRGRGRPQGSGNLQMLASLGEFFADTAATDFRAHVIKVHAGEDVIAKIMSLVQNCPRSICVLSANGTVSAAAIRQPSSSGGVISYEGEFGIVSLNGSSTVSETGGVRSRTGGFSVLISRTDGHMIGGMVAGPLVAAAPIQAVVGSFLPNAFINRKRKQQYEARSAAGRPDLRRSGAEGPVVRKPPPDINMAACGDE